MDCKGPFINDVTHLREGWGREEGHKYVTMGKGMFKKCEVTSKCAIEIKVPHNFLIDYNLFNDILRASRVSGMSSNISTTSVVAFPNRIFFLFRS